MSLDLPADRRAVLVGGAGALAAAFLAACGGDDTTVSPGATSGPSTSAPAPDAAKDLKLIVTAASLENLAIDTYQSILDGGRLTTASLVDAATLLKTHHEEQLESVNEDVTSGGSETVTKRNEAVYDALVKPKLDAATAEGAVMELLIELEHALAQTYTWAAGKDGFTTTDLRKKAGSIAGVDARHVAVLQVVGTGAAPASVFGKSGFFDATNPLADIDGAMLDA
jgi:hypothetical protein